MTLTKTEIEEMMDKPLLAHFAVIRRGSPHVSPIWVHYENGVFYFTTRAGRVKGVALRENPTVAVSIATDTTPYRAILFKGKAEIIESDIWGPINKIVSKYVTTRFGKSEGEKLLKEWRNEPDRIAFLVRPTKLLTWDYGKGDLRRQDEGISMLTKI